MAREIIVALGCNQDCTYSEVQTVPLNGNEARALSEQAAGSTVVFEPSKAPFTIADRAYTDTGYDVPVHITNSNLSATTKLGLKFAATVSNKPSGFQQAENCPGMQGENCPHAVQLSELAGQLSMHGLISKEVGEQ